MKFDQNIKISIAIFKSMYFISFAKYWFSLHTLQTQQHFPLFWIRAQIPRHHCIEYELFFSRIINWPWEIIFVPTWIVLCISLVGVLYTIIFAGILLRMTEVNAEQRRTSTNSALGKFIYFEKARFFSRSVLIWKKTGDKSVQMVKGSFLPK